MTPIEILLVIQFLAVFIIDYSGAVEDMLTPLVKRLTGSRIGHIGKPFSCSLCTTFWVGLLYIIIAGLPFWQYMAVVAALAIATPVTFTAINFVKDLLFKVFEWLYTLFNL